MSIQLEAIAFVKNERKKIEDDNWGAVISSITLEAHILEEAFEGIDAFSHLQIIFYMNQVIPEKAVAQYRHPRNDKNLPKLGTYAQRNKNRPNQLGLTTVKLIKREGRSIWVQQLDAIDGTPILDIKPVMEEYLPKEEVIQPDWTRSIMANYWETKNE